jgi:hypothetical protein
MTLTLLQHPDVKSIMAKIAAITNIPPENYESFQVGSLRTVMMDEFMNFDGLGATI